jgi:hypothetical protein
MPPEVDGDYETVALARNVGHTTTTSHRGRHPLCRRPHFLAQGGELRDCPRRHRGDRARVAARGLGLGHHHHAVDVGLLVEDRLLVAQPDGDAPRDGPHDLGQFGHRRQLTRRGPQRESGAAVELHRAQTRIDAVALIADPPR